MATLGQVFVPGGLPKITYNPRESLRLEEKVRDYLDERHKVLSLSGPTKSGKTVLLKTVVPEAIWVSGGPITSVDGFWAVLTDHVGGYSEVGAENSSEASSGSETSGGLQGGVPGVLQGGGGHKRFSQGVQGRRDSGSRKRPPHVVAGESLRATAIPLVIDDFHYMDPDVQVGIVRGLKELVFDGVPVVLASVPHRAYDAVRVEREMTGRVDQLPIEFWSPDELRGIAEKGFEALSVTASDEIIDRLIEEAFSSPHLMQEFCLQLCKANDIRETQSESVELEAPDWMAFLPTMRQPLRKPLSSCSPKDRGSVPTGSRESWRTGRRWTYTAPFLPPSRLPAR